MSNSRFGKTMENIKSPVDIQLIEEQALKLAALRNYESRTIFHGNLLTRHMKRTKLVYSKPIHLDMCILDLSTTLMYDFHYNFIKPKYQKKCKTVIHRDRFINISHPNRGSF
jgi:hypothetical protein